jgi:hypothetical protein
MINLIKGNCMILKKIFLCFSFLQLEAFNAYTVSASSLYSRTPHILDSYSDSSSDSEAEVIKLDLCSSLTSPKAEKKSKHLNSILKRVFFNMPSFYHKPLLKNILDYARENGVMVDATEALTSDTVSQSTIAKVLSHVGSTVFIKKKEFLENLIVKNEAEILKNLLTEGFKIRSDHIRLAILRANPATLKTVLEYSNPIRLNNSSKIDDLTPLMLALKQSKSDDVIKIIIDQRGINLESANAKNQTALDFAIDRPEIYRLLVAKMQKKEKPRLCCLCPKFL